MAGYYRLKEFGFNLPSGAHVLPRNMVEPMDAATELVEEARRQAARIVADADRVFEEERLRGFEEGQAAARLDAVERLLGESRELDRRLAGLEAGLAEIVVAGVCSLVQTFDDREQAAILVRAGLKQMRREKRAELRVSREHYAFMRGAIEAIVADFPEVEMVDVVEDATLAPPRITLETSVGRIDGDIGRSLEDLIARIRGAASRGEPDGEAVPPEMPR